MKLYESDVEEAAIQWLKNLGYDYIHGTEIAPDAPTPERKGWDDCILEGRFRAALARINPHLDADARDEVVRKVRRLDSPSLPENNHAFQKLLTGGVGLQVRKDGQQRGDQAWLIDFDNPDNNDWLVVNQLTVIEGTNNRRPDVVVYLNGLPVAVIELKNPEDENATLEGAWNQLQTYKAEIPSLFITNELMVTSDGVKARVGSLTAGKERFGPWRTVDGITRAPDSVPQLQVVIEGLFDRQRLLDYMRHFVLWETDDGFIKKIAGYHQFHAANKAVEATVRASSPDGDKRIGVVWHTQGSGKSISMVFYAGKLIVNPALENPTIVVVTDRNDLDGQLFAQFSKAPDLLREPPVQAKSRGHLRELLDQRASGGIIFTTMQKWTLTDEERGWNRPFPPLSRRRNIVVMADEAHRSQYGFATKLDAETGAVTTGMARNLRDGLPNASFIGFTGTPIEFDDKSTPAVFGDYVDTYTISQAVEDGSTVPIYYEARLAKIVLADDKKPVVDDEFEDITEGEEEQVKGKLKTRWARLEAMVGTEERLSLVAKDIVEHWARRSEIMNGKAMIVGMSRRICVDLYNEIVKIHPEWNADDDAKGAIKVVMTGAASDPAHFQPHIRNKPQQKIIEKRFKDADDSLRLVIVRDMWLTGFDAPCANTLYLDKPMKGHGLMQAIARVNRVFGKKPGGLVVDYLGLADQLRKAVRHYGGKKGEKPGIPVDVALAVLEEKFDVVKAMFHGFDNSGYFSTDPTARLSALAAGADHICGPADGKKRFLDAMVLLNKAAGLALHLEGARHLRDEVGYFQAIQKNLKKYTLVGGKTTEELDTAIKQIVSGAVASEEVVDIFRSEGLKRPDISVLSDDFLETVKASPHRNLQVELLKKLLNDEVRTMGRRNVVQSKKFSEMLERTLASYMNRSVETADVIGKLIEMAKEMRDAPKRGEKLGLDEDELAFYDALIDHGDVRDVMGDKILAEIAHELVESIRRSVTIDWTQKEAVKADLRRKVKRLLRKKGYPPDKRKQAVITVLAQAEAVARDWGTAA